ncbi:hypothetical protein [Pseudocitrobacter corydidari]|uniref:Uncharacterized protein n=1 Tax=Pseudocitrobacter corydidari TaxID=2891570 RepID=A0ABY3S908_9ENTR|nr:hypothetical protein [Pseudocitrobacter corydidari]UGS42641.1 hypothetical protein G163CM_33900 [Pseudocitrobacter corydidari]
MQEKSFWQVFFGNKPFSKSEYIKAWIGWWVISIVLLFVLWSCTTLNLRGIGIGLSFGFCQINARYLMSIGWNKFIGVLGVFPVTNIILFIVLLFTHKK